ncbi:MAG TPA: hypothetical protein VJ798_00930, partial [Rhizomicrobium sp.]|nr:hypothetical protein [Rhizomicrobium sp.]
MKAAFRHILLAALLIRALLPVGWMPGQVQLGEAAYIICAADGSIQHGAPGKDESAKTHQPCAFAAASQFFDLPEAAFVVAPSLAAFAAPVIPAREAHAAARF